jgi:DNA polymerase-4/DNA polymerase V
LHVDGDSFFVACELTRRPWLKGRPAVTGGERGIVTAATREAKALGVTRAMPIFQLRKKFPQVIVLPSDYRMYSQYAQRMYAIVRRHAREVEEYSIDECFADLTGLAELRGTTYEALARQIQDELMRSLDISFSIGVGVNKCTAKIASKWSKPHGLTVMPRSAIPTFLEKLPVGKVWGIGSATTIYLRKLGVTTALELARKDRVWVAEHCDRPLAEIYEEFQGNFVKELNSGEGDRADSPASVQRTRTFHPASRDRAFLWSQISYHVEDACMRLRTKGLDASHAGFFLKTSDFQYARDEVALPERTAAAHDILRAIELAFEKMWKGVGSKDVLFRASGISLRGLAPVGAGTNTATLFAAPVKSAGAGKVGRAIDRLARKFGKHSIFLGSSFQAMKHDGDLDEPTGRDRALDIIYLGEVR